ncbi:hypothetical protein IGL98_001385 [Enterococcus sp. DIV0840]|uniref:sce7726 family protein n=1 Tax=unclassified Enterococcus TaxID=2608891 RepID=UPI001A8C319F|nr:sce7726 family protein [Enterococcus sp. DIV0849a]MBO0436113.1 sce7726 family protein [Enterococcus sp. DIV0849a]
MHRLDDSLIREALIERLKTYKNCTIIEEITVPTGKARADVVAINGHVCGYEIKSNVDSLERLPNQLKWYDYSFEMNTIVTGEKYYDKVLKFVPEYWGIILVLIDEKGQLKLKFIRKAKLNPKLIFSDFVSFLPSNEIKKIAKNDEILNSIKLTKREINEMFKQDLTKELEMKLPKSQKMKLKVIIRNSLKSLIV